VTVIGPMFTTVLYADVASHQVLAYLIKSELFGRKAETLILRDAQPVTAAAFEPIIKIGGRSVNVYDERKRLEEELSKPLATYNVPGGTVNVRSVVANARGDVFVLYTGISGKYGTNVIPMVVTDDRGGVYAKGNGFQPHEYEPGAWQGFAFDGKPLEGAWFIHLSGPNPPGPNSSGQVTVGFKKEFEPMTNLAFRHKEVPVRAAGDLPSFMPFMGMALMPGDGFLQTRDYTVADFYTQIAPNYPKAERAWREYLAISEPLMKKNHLKSLNPSETPITMPRLTHSIRRVASQGCQYRSCACLRIASIACSGFRGSIVERSRCCSCCTARIEAARRRIKKPMTAATMAATTALLNRAGVGWAAIVTANAKLNDTNPSQVISGASPSPNWLPLSIWMDDQSEKASALQTSAPPTTVPTRPATRALAHPVRWSENTKARDPAIVAPSIIWVNHP